MERAAARVVDVVMSVVMKNVYHIRVRITSEKAQNKEQRKGAAPRLLAVVLFSLDLLFSRDALAGLIANGAARLASGLAGASAFAAARHFLCLRFCDRTDHNIFSCLRFFPLYNGAAKFASVFSDPRKSFHSLRSFTPASAPSPPSAPHTSSSTRKSALRRKPPPMAANSSMASSVAATPAAIPLKNARP